MQEKLRHLFAHALFANKARCAHSSASTKPCSLIDGIAAGLPGMTKVKLQKDGGPRVSMTARVVCNMPRDTRRDPGSLLGRPTA